MSKVREPFGKERLTSTRDGPVTECGSCLKVRLLMNMAAFASGLAAIVVVVAVCGGETELLKSRPRLD